MATGPAKPQQYVALMTWLTGNSQRRFYQACSLGGLTPTQAIALDTIRSLHEPNMSTLAQRLHLTPGAVTTLLDRLERNGLATRAPDPQDRRSICLHVTPKGESALQAVATVQLTQAQTAFDHLSPNEQDQLLAGLEALRQAWQQVPEVTR